MVLHDRWVSSFVWSRGDGARRAGCSAWLTALGTPTATVLPTLVFRHEGHLPPTHRSDTRDTILTNSPLQTHTSLLKPVPQSLKPIHVRHGNICFPHDRCPFLGTLLTSPISCTPDVRPSSQNSPSLFLKLNKTTTPLQRWVIGVSYTISYC